MAAFCFLAAAGRAESETETKPDAPKTPPIVDSISVRPGDRWTYRWIDDITGETKSYQTYTLTEIKDGAFSVAITTNPVGSGQSLSGLYVYDENWGLLDDGVWTRKVGDPITGVRLPLKIGLKWETHFTASRKNPDRESTIDTTSVVTGYEEVSFRFGPSYDAFKIETNESIATVGGGPIATLQVVLWYAPAVNRYVKRVIESRINDRLQSRAVEMLTEYRRRHED
ncbi:hypothetical protein [Methylocystis bryophila]|nr:hypothetical protein [Methylocystis bryophila]BDV40175.1 hypothetical protein DSM21852_34280 [Methylocystis bryophila]